MKAKQLHRARKLLAVVLSSALALSTAATIVFASPGEGIDPSEHEFSVIGQFNNWEDDLLMTDEDSDGVYEAVIEDLRSGETQLKVRMDQNWDDNWGLYSEENERSYNSGDNFVFNVPARMDVLISFDTNYDSYYSWRISAEPIEGSDENYEQNVGKYNTMSVLGTIVGDYDVDTDMEYKGKDVYSVEFTNIEAGQYEFKIRADHAWNQNWGVWDESKYSSKYGDPVQFDFKSDVTRLMISFNTSDDSEDNWIIDYDYWTVDNLYYSGQAIKGSDAPDPVEIDPTEHSFGVIGAMTGWGVDDDLAMSDDDGDGVYSVRVDPVNEDTEFRVRTDGEWDYVWGRFNDSTRTTLHSDLTALVRPSGENTVEIRIDTNGDPELWTISVAYIDDEGNERTDRFDDSYDPDAHEDEPFDDDISKYYYFDENRTLHILPGFEKCHDAEGYFSYNDDVFSVIVEFGVTAIPDSLFDGCQELMSVELPDWLERIGDNAFRDCDKLEGEMILPEDVNYIGESAFAGCRNLSVAVVEVGVQTVSRGAFANCTGLTELALSSNLRMIDAGAFRRCQGLKEVTIRPNVTEIVGNAFAGCSPDMVIKGVPGTKAEEFAESAGFRFVALDEFEYDFEDDGTIFITRYNGTASTVVVPSTIDGYRVTRIGACAFILNEYISNVEIPAGVNTIGMRAFSDCPNLETVTLNDGIELINGGAFMNCPNLRAINFPDSLKVLGPHAFSDCSKLERLNEVNDLESMGAEVFNSTKWFDDHEDGAVYFGNVLIGYKGNVPYGTTLEIRDGTVGVAAGALAGSWGAREGITAVTFPESLRYVEPNAFWEMYNYKEIRIPETVTRIEDGGFACYWDQENNKPGHIDGVVFYVKEGSAAYRYAKSNGFDYVITEAIDHSGTTGDCTWEYDPDSWTITISGNGAMADYGRDNPAPWKNFEVYNFIVENGVTTVGSDACMGLGGREQGLYVSLPDSVVSIGTNAFNALNGPLELNGNKKTELPANLETIGSYAIFNPAIDNIFIPATVTSIGECGIGYWYNDETERDEKVDNYTIHCIKGSAADTYAQQNGFFCVYVMDNGLEYYINDDRTVTITGFISDAESLVIPDTIDGLPVVEIGNGAFRGNFDTLEEVTLPSGLMKIGESAFNSLFRMRSIQFPDSLEYIGDSAFVYTNLCSVDLPDSLTYIGDFAFFSTDLGSIEIPASVSTIGDCAVGYQLGGDTAIPREDFVIYGTVGSAAQTYAEERGFDFVDIDAGKLKNTSTVNSERLSLGPRITITGSAEEGTGDYSYSYYYKRSNGKVWKAILENTNAATASFAPKDCAEYDIKVVVNDSAGSEAEKLFRVTVVDGNSDAFTNTSYLSSYEIKPKTRVYFYGQTDGTQDEVRYAFYYKRTNSSNWVVLGTEFGDSTSVSLKPTSEGTMDIRIDAMNSSGEIVSRNMTLVISQYAGNLPVNRSTISADSVKAGTRVTITGAAEGGSGNYTYTYKQKTSSSAVWKVLAENTTSTTASFKPGNVGSYDILVTVMDGTGAAVDRQFRLTVT